MQKQVQRLAQRGNAEEWNACCGAYYHFRRRILGAGTCSAKERLMRAQDCRPTRVSLYAVRLTNRQQLPCIKPRAPWYILVESICEYYVNHSSGQYYLDYCYIHNKDTIMIRTSETTDSIRFKHPFIHNAYVNLIQILYSESRLHLRSMF